MAQQRAKRYIQTVGRRRQPPRRINAPTTPLQTRLTVATVTMLQAVANAVPVREIEDAIVNGGFHGVLRLLDLENRMWAVAHGQGLDSHQRSLVEVLREIFQRGAEDALHQLNDVPVRKFNPHHEPAGSPEGGEFTSSGGGSEHYGLPVYHTTNQVAANHILKEGLKVGEGWGQRAPSVYFTGSLEGAKQYAEFLPNVSAGQYAIVEFKTPKDAVPDENDRNLQHQYPEDSTLIGLNMASRVEHSISPKDIIAIHFFETDMATQVVQEAGVVRPGEPNPFDLESIHKSQSSFALVLLRPKIQKAANSIGTRMTFDLMSENAVQWLENYTFSQIQGLSQESQQAIQDALIAGFEGGGGTDGIARSIRTVIGLTRQQAQAVRNYRTALESGNESQMMSAIDRALRDARFDRSVLSAIEQAATLPQEKIDRMVSQYASRSLNYRSQTIARTECLAGDTLVTGAVVRAVFRRWYDGPMVEILTTNGRKFSATPNHPHLTSRGWTSAGQIQEGDNLICYGTGFQDLGLSGNCNIQYPPTTIDEIFNSLRVVGIPMRKRTTSIDFHGDGSNSYVDIFSTNRKLHFGLFTSINKSMIDILLSYPNFANFKFCHVCSELLPINQCCRFCKSSQGHFQSFQKMLNCLAGCLEVFCKSVRGFTREIASRYFLNWQVAALAGAFNQGKCFGTTSHDTRFFKNFSYSLLPHSNSFDDTPDTQSCEIELDRVSSVSIRNFSGHVYNLETPSGYFNISGVYTGNTIRASAKGQAETWAQAQSQGLLPADQKQIWIASDDACPICLDIEDMNSDGIALDDDFDTPDGPLDGPPQHSNCRCSTGLLMDDNTP